ncbi:hypothetical protein [Virgibacillus sp. YIM 98842]|uniref:hypothetical protein n=1 Tax=Virgibacillus sp. YIM 98842 TaxID=2663533 RepID=UPI0013DD5FC8|nr:hypothetical protein [Virgibacillus sp. YIM 98842]
MKSKIVSSLLILFLLGGCNVWGQKDIAEMDPSELPDVIAFQDDFTREFMGSLEEVEDGYYLFESKTGGYTMMYPQNAKMDHLFYQRTGDNYEYIQLGENEETNEFNYYVRATYDEGRRAVESETLLNLLSTYVSYEGDYEKIDNTDTTIYFATTEYVTESGKSTTNRFFGTAMSNNSDQSVRFIYNLIDDNEDADNAVDLESIQGSVLEIMKSIEFNSVE